MVSSTPFSPPGPLDGCGPARTLLRLTMTGAAPRRTTTGYDSTWLRVVARHEPSNEPLAEKRKIAPVSGNLVHPKLLSPAAGFLGKPWESDW